MPACRVPRLVAWCRLRLVLALLLLLILARSGAAQSTLTSGHVVTVGSENYCDTVGSSANAYACNLLETITEYNPGATYRFLANAANTGAATLQLNSIATPRALVKFVGGVNQPLIANDIRAGAMVTVIFDGTSMQVQSVLGTVVRTSKFWLPGAMCQNTTATLLWDTRTTAIPVAACATSHGVADFATDSGTLSMHQTLLLPSDVIGIIEGQVWWFSAATANNVAWQVELLCLADAVVDSITFANTTEIVDTAKGTTNQLNVTALSTLTSTGCDPGELMHVQIRRDPADAQDTLAAATTARFYGLELTIRRTQ